MRAADHNKILAIGFAIYSAIFAFTFLLLMLVSLGVFVALGISFANETGDSKQAGFGILGGIFAAFFYGVLAVVFVLPTALASLRMLKRRRRARLWAFLAALAVLPLLPLGTIFGVYGLWFFFSLEGREFYSRFDSPMNSPLSDAKT